MDETLPCKKRIRFFFNVSLHVWIRFESVREEVHLLIVPTYTCVGILLVYETQEHPWIIREKIITIRILVGMDRFSTSFGTFQDEGTIRIPRHGVLSSTAIVPSDPFHTVRFSFSFHPIPPSISFPGSVPFFFFGLDGGGFWDGSISFPRLLIPFSFSVLGSNSLSPDRSHR